MLSQYFIARWWWVVVGRPHWSYAWIFGLAWDLASLVTIGHHPSKEPPPAYSQWEVLATALVSAPGRGGGCVMTERELERDGVKLIFMMNTAGKTMTGRNTDGWNETESKFPKFYAQWNTIPHQHTRFWYHFVDTQTYKHTDIKTYRNTNTQT